MENVTDWITLPKLDGPEEVILSKFHWILKPFIFIILRWTYFLSKSLKKIILVLKMLRKKLI